MCLSFDTSPSHLKTINYQTNKDYLTPGILGCSAALTLRTPPT